MVADAETVNLNLSQGSLENKGIEKIKNDDGSRTIELDVLSEQNAEKYWSRSDNYDTVIDMRVWGQANTALCRVLEKWVSHFYKVTVKIQPLEEIKEDKWIWHIGLDAESSSLLNDLYNGKPVDAERSQRLISLFRMEIKDETFLKSDISGKPIYLGMAMTPVISWNINLYGPTRPAAMGGSTICCGPRLRPGTLRLGDQLVLGIVMELKYQLLKDSQITEKCIRCKKLLKNIMVYNVDFVHLESVSYTHLTLPTNREV